MANKLAEEFRDLLELYVKLTADLTRIADTGESEEDPQALIQSILDNHSCLTDIQQLNKRLIQLYDVWKGKEASAGLTDGDEVRVVVKDVREQVRQLEKLCSFGVQKVEARRKQLSTELMTLGKGSRYLEMLKPIKENYPKFIDSSG